MSWRVLTRDDVLRVLTEPETAAYESAAKGAEQDVIAEVLESVVNECRSAIADHAPNQLAAGLTLPDRALHHAVAIIRFRLLTRLDITVSEDRRTEYHDARKFFDAVAEGRRQIELPDGALSTEAAPGQAIEVVNSSPREMTRESMKGL